MFVHDDIDDDSGGREEEKRVSDKIHMTCQRCFFLFFPSR
jgi:hypothetical protein